ncbi:PilN domain-containing protein [Acuticoccus sp.]|uniref:PilN domain-containing protein n=1 Tax=Acuticoccus sp. TaxID=1904378 RepID=UPI003B5176EB
MTDTASAQPGGMAPSKQLDDGGNRGAFDRLLDAFAEVLDPLLRRTGAAARLVAVDGDDGLTLWRVSGRTVDRLGRVDELSEPAERTVKSWGGRSVELRLGEGKVLRRTVRLPDAARDVFAAVLHHRLDRMTPWRGDQVLFGYEAADVAEPDGHVAVDVVATSRAIAEAAARPLAGLGLTPTILGVAGADLAQPVAVDLYRGAADPSRRRSRRRLKVAVVTVLVLLGAAAAGSAWLAARAEVAGDALGDRAAAVRRAVVERSGAQGAADPIATLLAAKLPDRSIALFVDGLATVLPDDSHLTALSVDEASVRLTGISDDAPSLIAVLEGADGLTDVRFAAPVVRDGDGRDAFDILATRAPAVGEP